MKGLERRGIGGEKRMKRKGKRRGGKGRWGVGISRSLTRLTGSFPKFTHLNSPKKGEKEAS